MNDQNQEKNVPPEASYLAGILRRRWEKKKKKKLKCHFSLFSSSFFSSRDGQSGRFKRCISLRYDNDSLRLTTTSERREEKRREEKREGWGTRLFFLFFSLLLKLWRLSVREESQTNTSRRSTIDSARKLIEVSENDKERKTIPRTILLVVVLLGNGENG